ncbi:MAG: hypothetical protein QOE63_1776 [Acidimicrobiaceae bacterium]
MRVGLLMCDHVDGRFRAIAGDYDDMFGALFSDLDLVPYDAVGGVLPKAADDCDAWLLTGSRHSAYDDEPWISALSAFVRDLHVAGAPTVGICFGHQLLAHALGGRVERAASGWGVGAHAIERSADLEWRLLFMHQDQVVALPDDGVVLGSTDHCPVAALQIGPSMVGVQAHPEFSADYERALLDLRVERIGEAKVAAARASLDAPTDERAAASWLAAFMGGAHA